MDWSRGPPDIELRSHEHRRGCVPVTGAGEGEKLQSLLGLWAHTTDASGPDATCQSGSRRNKDIASFPATEPIESVWTPVCAPCDGAYLPHREAPAWPSEASLGANFSLRHLIFSFGKFLRFFFRVSGTAGASSFSSATPVGPAGTGPDSSVHATVSPAEEGCHAAGHALGPTAAGFPPRLRAGLLSARVCPA